jgi:hypothetical protein
VANLTPANVPATIEPITSAYLSYPNLRITWKKPDESGSAISSYQVVFLNKLTSTFVEVTSLCNGATDPAKSAKTCDFNCETLISTYGYTPGDLFVAKARAYNSIGWGTLSSPNTSGATV